MLVSKTQKLFAVVLAMLIFVMSLNVGTMKVTANDATGYEIYPIPHSVSYQDGQVSFSGNINVVYGNDIDKETKARFDEIVALKQGVTATPTDSIKDGVLNVLVGTQTSNDVVKQYFDENYTLTTTGLFEKLDSYVLSIKNNTILIMGKDVDSAFYGLTTLYHIVKQISDNNIRNLAIEDFADVASRGFIEGYYGNPWSTEDRVKLMEWGGYYKLNSYFYAPKDDPKHNANWRELYTEEEINTKIKPLAQAGNNSKCRFVYALHPYMYNAIRYNNEENYQADLKIMQDKFLQVIKAGVRQIAILADDAGNVGGENYIKTLNDMTNWIKEQQKTYPDLKITLPFCTQEYMGWGEGYYERFPENVQIVMTGGKVWGEVSQNFTNAFTQKVKRGPYMWINWPCTDNSKKHLIMGGFKDFLHYDVDPTQIQGIVLNPMQQSEPSKVAIFGNACYSWNIWDNEAQADTAWENSFKYVDHNSAIETDASNALKELSKHMINQNMDGRVRVLQESVELKEILNPFKDALSNGTVTAEMVDTVIAEFDILDKATDIFESQAGDTRLKNQMIYWINCWKDTTDSAINYLNAIKANLNGEDSSKVWDLYSKGKDFFAKSKTYGFHYVDHTEYAEVGVQHIVPFIKSMESYLSDVLNPIINPEKQVIKPITNRTDAPTNSINNMIDGDNTTFAQWQNPNSSKVGEYMGVTFTKAIKLNELKILVSNSGSGKVNGFAGSKLQYTVDGKEWIDIPNSEHGKVHEVSATGLDLDVKGVRVICTVDSPDIWPAVREILVNGKPLVEKPETSYTENVIKTDRYTVFNNQGDEYVIDGNDNTFAWYNTGSGDNSLVGDFIGIDLGKVLPIEKVRFVMGNGGDFWSAYDLEYSQDGNQYTKIESYTQTEGKKTVEKALNGIEARYVRLKNTKQKNTWLKMTEFKVTPIVPTGTVDTNSDALKGNTVVVKKDVGIITPTGEITLNANEYIGIDLGRIKDLSAIISELTNGDNLTVEASKNYVSWENIDTSASELPDARYVRLINKTSSPITFTINKFEVKSNEISSPFLHESNIGIDPNWGVAEDSRNNGAAFDGNVNTTTEFADLPQKGEYIIYDLGQVRDIKKLEMFCQDSAVNYIRDAEILVSNSLDGEWTKVVTIGDGIENKNDANVQCINSRTESGEQIYKASSTYPNKVSVSGEIPSTKARYLKIVMTATNNNRAVLFNEIFINDGEYVPVENDPTFTSSAIEVQGMPAQNMTDGDLSTAYKANTKDAGYITYTLSEKLDLSKVNIIQNGEPSNAKVSFLVESKKSRATQEWVEVGTLSKSLNEFYFPFWDRVYEMKIEWDADKAPTIAEVIFINDKQFGTDHTELTEYLNSLNINENEYTANSYKAFKEIYDKAVAVNENSQSTQKELQQAKADVEQAKTLLIPRGDISKVNAELDKIANLLEDDFTTDTWTALQTVVVKANELIKTPENVSAQQVEEIVLELQKAVANLKPSGKITITTLKQLVKDYNLDTVDITKYTADTAKAFTSALNDAEAVIALQAPTDKQVLDAYTALQNAINGLQLKATQEQIDRLNNLMNSYVKDNYTNNSWQAFAVVVDEVKTALQENLSSAQVEALITKVTEAAKSLVRKGDTTKLDELLKVVSSLDPAKYEKASYDNLIAVHNEIMDKLKDKDNMSQADVDALYAKLDNAYKALKGVSINNNNQNNNGGAIAQTGDYTSINPFIIVILILAVVGIVVVLIKKKSFNKKK